MIRTEVLFLFFILSLQPLLAQQIGDPDFKPEIKDPAYTHSEGPTVTIDEAHNNFHTIEGRFNAFANVVRADGYNVKPGQGKFTREELSKSRILVISNALHEDNIGEWSLPTPSAFTTEEIEALNHWVQQGGSLFLIADHMPFPGAAEQLAQSFGITFYNGFVRRTKAGKDIFTFANKGLLESSLTKGRTNDKSVTSIRSFTGQCFDIPTTATPVLVFGEEYENLLPETAWEFEENTTTKPAKGCFQGAYMTYGKGRLVVFGEAAMFTSQKSRGNKFGMSAPDAGQNMQLLLNILHWLDHIID